ncbi:CBS domain-containing protein [Actinomycetospora lemnae]|uniref:CBS domain-containing protein n=1 Tax=Actinomycetospora lemnae TaxID=3019891 RepID=A0ABT5SZ04_9PSEU|nr:CBS domain-containing protein [Actinomycetospora sp. DW7H6]MDD7967941.1 CBS domain-containing protein [Actinomycetospora sp. DW7H6]
MKVRDIMSHPVVSVRPDTPVSEAASLMVERGFSSMPIEDDAEGLVGIVGEADLVRGRIPAQDGGTAAAHAGRVGDVMTRSPMTCEPGADVADVVGTMLDHRLRAVPVVEGGRLVGMLARRDVLRCVAQGELTSAEVWRHRFGLVDHERG